MSRIELKEWSKSKIKGHVFELIIPIIITYVLNSLTLGGSYDFHDGFKVFSGAKVGLLFYFVQVGFAYYMLKFVNDKPCELKDLFHFSNDFVRDFLTNLLQTVFIVLWFLLLIVPGIIKSIAYSMVPIVLADAKYKDLGFMDILKKSEEIMNGHKYDFFILTISFIGWHILAIFTLGLLELWILPYQNTACYKFLNDVKKEYENSNS